jgi:hypothetical protein
MCVLYVCAKKSVTAFLNASLLVTFLIEIDKLFQSFIALYEKLLVLHKFVFGVIQFKLEVSLILGSGLTKKLQILQNKVVRFVLDLGPRTRINCDIICLIFLLL